VSIDFSCNLVYYGAIMSSENLLFQQYGKTFQKGALIFSEGEIGEHVYLIQTGKVRVFKLIGDQDKTLAILGPGDFFGEMAIFEKKPRSASAEALSESKVLVLDQATFEELIKSNGEIALRVIKRLVSRLRNTDTLLECISLPDPLMRIVSLLVSAGYDDSGSNKPIEISLGLDDIARLCGLNTGTAEAIIEKLVTLNLISFEEQKIFITDYQGLVNYKEILGIKK
jgi:CRP-like cAMP-binding protein